MSIYKFQATNTSREVYVIAENWKEAIRILENKEVFPGQQFEFSGAHQVNQTAAYVFLEND